MNDITEAMANLLSATVVEPEYPNREEVRATIGRKFPTLPDSSADWVSEMLSDLIEADVTTADASFHREIERAIRAGEEDGIQVALAALRAV